MDTVADPFNMGSLVKCLGHRLRENRSKISSEAGIQEVIASALKLERIDYEREHRLSVSCRLDFLLPQSGFLIEVKKGAANIGDLAQIGRYLEHDKCQKAEMNVPGQRY